MIILCRVVKQQQHASKRTEDIKDVSNVNIATKNYADVSMESFGVMCIAINAAKSLFAKSNKVDIKIIEK